MRNKFIHLPEKIRIAAYLLVFSLFAACGGNPQPATVAAYRTLEDLDGKTVAVVAGSTSDVLLSDTDNFPNITLVRCITPSGIIDTVEEGTADCGITDSVVLMTLAMETHGLAVDFNLPGGFDVAAAFNPKDEDLCRQFNDFLVQIKATGLLDEMLARWCNTRFDTVSMPLMPDLAELKGHPFEVATLADNAPFSFYKDNHWTGMEVELMLRFSLYAGRPVHFSGYAFDEIVAILHSEKADAAVANMFITPDRANQVLFSNPYYFCKTSCFSKAR